MQVIMTTLQKVKVSNRLKVVNFEFAFYVLSGWSIRIRVEVFLAVSYHDITALNSYEEHFLNEYKNPSC